jgi:hypothetical protein
MKIGTQPFKILGIWRVGKAVATNPKEIPPFTPRKIETQEILQQQG